MDPSILQPGAGKLVPVAGVNVLASPRVAHLGSHLVLHLL